MRAETKILTFQPLVYQVGDERLRVTNLGAIVRALSEQGFNAQQVAFAPEADLVGRVVDGIRLCSPAQASDPNWWKEMNPWAVIANMWGAPRFGDVRKAILSSTPRLVDRLDSDGNRSVYADLPLYIHAMWSRLRDMPEKRMQRFFSPLIPFGQALAHSWFPSLLDRRQAIVLREIPIVTVESPIAVERIIRFQQTFGHSGKNVHFSPFPVDESTLPPVPPLETKANRVISVGRWNAHQKNFPMMLRVLNDFLKAHADWDAVVPGTLPRNADAMLARYCPDAGNRVDLISHLQHDEICQQIGRSRVFLMTSRHESFGIAAAEALCLGCSVVGPAHIPSIPWFCSNESGTVATLYTKNGLLDALSSEAKEWIAGNRSPEHISKIWRGRVGAQAVATKLIKLLEKVVSSVPRSA
jgi:hypothetical protein